MKTTQETKPEGLLSRARRFLRKPSHEQSRSLYARWKRLFPTTPFPVRLPFGAWWVVRNDHVGQPIVESQFETAELAFVGRFLQPGMTVLDIGAHHGLYTLLASKRVGPGGRVFAFEPSPRERKALLRHLKLNRCKNVTVQALALGNEEGEAVLNVVHGFETGCNSLRPPFVLSGTSPVRVQLTRLDDWLRKQGIERVDFIKLDVEGGELAVLKGAARLLDHRPRPVILAEVEDRRTGPWGYRAHEIVQLLGRSGYDWFRLLDDGDVQPVPSDRETYDANLVAIPIAQVGETLQRLGGK